MVIAKEWLARQRIGIEPPRQTPQGKVLVEGMKAPHILSIIANSVAATLKPARLENVRIWCRTFT
jgi:hypothetical protein